MVVSTKQEQSKYKANISQSYFANLFLPWYSCSERWGYLLHHLWGGPGSRDCWSQAWRLGLACEPPCSVHAWLAILACTKQVQTRKKANTKQISAILASIKQIQSKCKADTKLISAMLASTKQVNTMKISEMLACTKQIKRKYNENKSHNRM